ncbi:NAD(P)-binding protein [Dendrothele bispora CBS 962.96]|uniref:NAD(P)-binding protein n=1 Tax=Dendrothele bispora (strain CBS 962.96) TaxID=1314807 RepID=A0A4S8LR79_DENBC|nr:NAD(P)-binding protein [Dendrothele bispora CBS 962.96]
MDETEDTCRKVATNPNFRFVQHIMDVRKEDQVIAAVERCIQDFGRMDYAANVAGIADSDISTIDQKMDEWDNVMNINTRGVYICMREEIKAMLKNPLKEIAPGRSTRGSVINMGSVGGLVVLSGIWTSYMTSKHAIAGMTKAAAVSHGKEGVQSAYEDLTPFGQPVAMKRMGEPEKIADVVLWLSSPESSYVTGTAITVDGGLTVMPRGGTE